LGGFAGLVRGLKAQPPFAFRSRAGDAAVGGTQAEAHVIGVVHGRAR